MSNSQPFPSNLARSGGFYAHSLRQSQSYLETGSDLSDSTNDEEESVCLLHLLFFAPSLWYCFICKFTLETSDLVVVERSANMMSRPSEFTSAPFSDSFRTATIVLPGI